MFNSRKRRGFRRNKNGFCFQRSEGFSGFGKRSRRFENRSFSLNSCDFNFPDSEEENLYSDEERCPLCKNHCYLSEPGCPKGEAFAMETKAA